MGHSPRPCSGCAVWGDDAASRFREPAGRRTYFSKLSSKCSARKKPSLCDIRGGRARGRHTWASELPPSDLKSGSHGRQRGRLRSRQEDFESSCRRLTEPQRRLIRDSTSDSPHQPTLAWMAKLECVSADASNDPPLVLRVADVAHLLQVSDSAVYALVASGELPSLRVGRSVRVPRAALEEWITAHTAPSLGDDHLRAPVGHDDRQEASVTGAKAAASGGRPSGDARRASASRRTRGGRQPTPTTAAVHPSADPTRERRPWCILVDASLATDITSDADLMTVVKRLEDKHWILRAQPIALRRSGRDTWYPDMVVLADNRLAEAVRAENPWFPIFDEERFRREIADMRADVLGEGKSPFPDRVKRREALRRRERRRERRERHAARERPGTGGA